MSADVRRRTSNMSHCLAPIHRRTGAQLYFALRRAPRSRLEKPASGPVHPETCSTVLYRGRPGYGTVPCTPE